MMTATGGATADTTENFVRAAANGSTVLVQKFLDDGVHTNKLNSRGVTPLMASAENGFVEVTKMLLDAGADVNRVSSLKYPALTYAAFGGHSNVVEALLGHGAKPNLRGRDGMSPLMAASAASNPKAVRLLINKGADVNATDENGRTSLMFAAASGNPQTVDVLVEAGAQRDARSSDALGLTAASLARIYQHAEVSNRLGDNEDVVSGFASATRMSDDPSLEPPTLKKRVRPNYTDNGLHRRRDGAVLLEVVITTAGRAEHFRVLTSIDIGLDLNAIDCVRQWRFNPGMRDGTPVDIVAEIEVSFSIC
jgi:TonB family protein